MATCTDPCYSIGTSNGHIWVQWVSTGTAGTTAQTLDNGSPWVQWVSGACAGTFTANTNTNVWVQWNNGAVASLVRNGDPQPFVPPRPPTPDELAAANARAELWKKQAEEERRKREEETQRRIAAEQRAEELLKAHLSAEQTEEYEKCGHFHVVGESGQRYRIRTKSPSINVDVIEGGKAVRRLCAYAPGLPPGDTFLCQKLALENNENEFLKVANVHAA